MKNILTALFLAAMIVAGLLAGSLITQNLSGENPIQMVMRWRDGEPKPIDTDGVRDGLEPDAAVQPGGNDGPADGDPSAEPEPPEADPEKEFFENVYVPYALRKKDLQFDTVKTFAEKSEYTYEIEEPDSSMAASVMLMDGENFVYIAFAPGAGDIETMKSVSYYRKSSHSEVSMVNYSKEQSPIYDKFQVRVVGEPIREVEGIDEQREFLFAQ